AETHFGLASMQAPAPFRVSEPVSSFARMPDMPDAPIFNVLSNDMHFSRNVAFLGDDAVAPASPHVFDRDPASNTAFEHFERRNQPNFFETRSRPNDFLNEFAGPPFVDFGGAPSIGFAGSRLTQQRQSNRFSFGGLGAHLGDDHREERSAPLNSARRQQPPQRQDDG